MTGKEVRDILLSNGVVLAELADQLSISAQTLNSRLNAKHFKVEYLNEITSITGISFDQNSDLMKVIESQQRTIETLSRTIEILSKKD